MPDLPPRRPPAHAGGAAFADPLEAAGAAERVRTAPARRRRLWDLRPDDHCSIHGTCLGLADLRKIADKTGLRLNPAATEHEAHGWFVELASEPGRLAKSMHEPLDRKHRNAIERCRRDRLPTRPALPPRGGPEAARGS